MTKNKLLCIADIREWNPCYDPARYLPKDWSGSVKGILRHRDIPAKDKLWVVLRPKLLDDKTLRLFAAACARRALNLIDNPDPRSIEACNVAEKFANGEATVADLNAAARNAAAAADAAAAAADSDERRHQINLLLTLIG